MQQNILNSFKVTPVRLPFLLCGLDETRLQVSSDLRENEEQQLSSFLTTLYRTDPLYYDLQRGHDAGHFSGFLRSQPKQAKAVIAQTQKIVNVLISEMNKVISELLNVQRQQFDNFSSRLLASLRSGQGGPRTSNAAYSHKICYICSQGKQNLEYICFKLQTCGRSQALSALTTIADNAIHCWERTNKALYTCVCMLRGDGVMGLPSAPRLFNNSLNACLTCECDRLAGALYSEGMHTHSAEALRHLFDELYGGQYNQNAELLDSYAEQTLSRLEMRGKEEWELALVNAIHQRMTTEQLLQYAFAHVVSHFNVQMEGLGDDAARFEMAAGFTDGVGAQGEDPLRLLVAPDLFDMADGCCLRFNPDREIVDLPGAQPVISISASPILIDLVDAPAGIKPQRSRGASRSRAPSAPIEVLDDADEEGCVLVSDSQSHDSEVEVLDDAPSAAQPSTGVNPSSSLPPSTRNPSSLSLASAYESDAQSVCDCCEGCQERITVIGAMGVLNPSRVTNHKRLQSRTRLTTYAQWLLRRSLLLRWCSSGVVEEGGVLHVQVREGGHAAIALVAGTEWRKWSFLCDCSNMCSAHSDDSPESRALHLYPIVTSATAHVFPLLHWLTQHTHVTEVVIRRALRGRYTTMPARPGAGDEPYLSLFTITPTTGRLLLKQLLEDTVRQNIRRCVRGLRPYLSVASGHTLRGLYLNIRNGERARSFLHWVEALSGSMDVNECACVREAVMRCVRVVEKSGDDKHVRDWLNMQTEGRSNLYTLCTLPLTLSAYQPINDALFDCSTMWVQGYEYTPLSSRLHGPLERWCPLWALLCNPYLASHSTEEEAGAFLQQNKLFMAVLKDVLTGNVSGNGVQLQWWGWLMQFGTHHLMERVLHAVFDRPRAPKRMCEAIAAGVRKRHSPVAPQAAVLLISQNCNLRASASTKLLRFMTNQVPEPAPAPATRNVRGKRARRSTRKAATKRNRRSI